MLRVTRREDSPYYYVEGRVAGRRFKRSTQTTNKKSAEKLCRKWQTALHNRLVIGDGEGKTLADAVAFYLEEGGEERFMLEILEARGLSELADINRTWMVELAKELYGENANPATVNRQLYTPMIAVLNSAADLDWCPPPRLKRPKGHGRQPTRVKWLAPETVERGIEAGDPHDVAILVAFVGIGLREEDMVKRLVWDEVWLEHKEARVDIGKSDDELHKVFLQPRVIDALRSLPQSTTGPVLRRPNGDAYAKEARYQFKPTWGRIAKAADIPHFTSHQLRHTWATWHHAVHKNLVRLRDEGSWKSVAMVERYAKNAPPDLKERLLALGWTMEA
ncbi:MAG: tyrosine-type recombinase/integrase [Pseudomonadota bacterium]